MLKPSDGDQSLSPAKVVIVGNIDRDRFRMSADVGWHVTSDSLASRYATALLEKPVHPLAHMTWTASMDNLRRLKDLLPQDLARVTADVTKGGKLSVRHASFKVRRATISFSC